MKVGFPVTLAVAGALGAVTGVGIRVASAPLNSSDILGQAELEPKATNANLRLAEAPNQEETKKVKKRKEADKKEKAESVSYFKFSRQFVAPIVRDGAPEAMIVLDVVLELSPESAESHYAIEPKLRDAVLRALLAQSGKGDLKRMLSDPSLLEETREAILAGVREIIADDAQAVLLMDVAYQPF